MKAGIVVYSHTGNTLQVAEKLRESLAAQGHEADILRVHAQNEDPNAKEPLKLTETPDVAPYDALFFGAPVYGFSLCPPMKAYLQQVGPLKGKRVGVFVTHHFPMAWLGGNRSARQMAALCESKGAKPGASAVVNWSGKDRDGQIRDAVGALGAGVKA